MVNKTIEENISKLKDTPKQIQTSTYKTDKQDEKRTSPQNVLVKPLRERTESAEKCKRKQNKSKHKSQVKANPSEYQLISQWKLKARRAWSNALKVLKACHPTLTYPANLSAIR